jgi:nucleoprotein TPR
MESQLNLKSNTLSEVRAQHSQEIRQIASISDERQWTLEKRERELASTRRHLELAQAELDRLRNDMYQKECGFIEQRELMEMDLNKERELVMLKEQAMLLARDQRDGAFKELEDMKAMAAEAAEREEKLEKEMEGRLRMEVENAVRLIRGEEEGKRVILVDRLRVAEEEKKRLEEDVLSKSPAKSRRGRMIASGSAAPLAITDRSDGPLGLTDLYTRLAETEDELRATQHENKKLKIIIDRIHRDVAAKTPIFQQKQIELENALEELDEQKERLDHARREVVDIRSDNHDLELKNQQMERECREMRRENHDLALQVQRLLQRGMMSQEGMEDDYVTFDSIQTLQEQNQKLLRDHHSMTEKISELEGHINNNPEKIELNELKVEVVSLREEREKQSKLVAGIVHQRDLYRALVAKNDAALIDSEAGNQLALVDAKADQLPMLEAKNRELVEESSKLRADLSTFKYEKDALEGRLARIDAHADELTASNERMRGELTAANATIARMEADVSQYRGRCERMEASLDAMRDEKESEASRRNRMEELNSKLQTQLDGARSTLAKHQQQLESVSGPFVRFFIAHSRILTIFTVDISTSSRLPR